MSSTAVEDEAAGAELPGHAAKSAKASTIPRHDNMTDFRTNDVNFGGSCLGFHPDKSVLRIQKTEKNSRSVTLIRFDAAENELSGVEVLMPVWRF